MDFEANAKEGVGVDWPIRYEDLEPWYAYVEKFIGVSGKKEGLKQLPDGEFLPPMEMTAVEKYFTQKVSEHYDDRIVTIGRVANLTREHNGRGACQYRNRCIRGCPYGAYFSSQSSTLPKAFESGNMELRPHSLVKEILFDDATQKATGVRIIDTVTMEERDYYAKIIFLNASTIGSTKILLQSTSARFPNGLGNDSGQLGHNLMDHHSYVGAIGFYDQLLDRYYKGRRPNGIYIPRFQNLDKDSMNKNFLRGYNYKGFSSRENWLRPIPGLEYGADFKKQCLQPGRWELSLIAYGECLPYHDNQIYLHPTKKDKLGLPQAAFKMEWKENEFAMRENCQVEAAEMLEKSGFKDVQMSNKGKNPGATIHEMGTARMGSDPKTSVLNKWNQVHAVKNVFVTDGSCMTSSACQNPSLTYMALTARATHHAISQLKKGEL
jgi:choline dehydrogenase-like flavoprotein